MKYMLSAPAAADIDEILDYIASQSVQNAALVAGRFKKAFEQLCEKPSLGHHREELADPSIRVYSVSGYLILYDSTLSPLHILRVVRGARDLKRVRRRKQAQVTTQIKKKRRAISFRFSRGASFSKFESRTIRCSRWFPRASFADTRSHAGWLRDRRPDT